MHLGIAICPPKMGKVHKINRVKCPAWKLPWSKTRALRLPLTLHHQHPSHHILQLVDLLLALGSFHTPLPAFEDTETSNQIQITLASACCQNWHLDDNNEGNWLIVLTNRSQASSTEGKLTRDGFSNSLSKRAVIHYSKTLCMQNYENIGFCEHNKIYNLFKATIFSEDHVV